MAVVIERSTTIASVPRGEHIETADQRVFLRVSWDGFQSVVAARGDVARPRVTYVEGTLELMSPSGDHEAIKMRLAAIVQAYMDHAGIRYEGLGAWLLTHTGSRTGLEPDDCYVLHDVPKSRPDLAIEVVWTSGGLDKLLAYQNLGVPEVWFWKHNRLRFFCLGGTGYEERERSLALPGFDASVVSEMLDLPTLSDVRRALRELYQ